jgi:hypothetical protein
MEKKSKTRYLNLVYIVVASLAIILALVGINYSQGTVQSILINLSTEFLGVVLIFLLIQRLFFIEELDVSSRLDKLLDRLEQQTGLLKGPEDNEPIWKLLAGKSDVWLLGESFARVLRADKAHLVECIRAGARLRIMILYPEGKACQLILDNLIVKDIQRNIQNALDYCQDIAKEIHACKKGAIEVRLIDWAPSCSLIILDPKKENGYCRVTIYPPYYSSPISDRAHFILRRGEDNRWYDTLVERNRFAAAIICSLTI